MVPTLFLAASLMGFLESKEVMAAVIGGLISGVLAIVAAYLTVKATIQGQMKSEAAQRNEELAAIRLALRTEVSMVGYQCLMEYKDWIKAVSQPIQKRPRSALLPPLTIYNRLASSMGRLSREEVVHLIRFSSTLYDVGVIARDMQESEIPLHPGKLVITLSNACGSAADSLVALPSHDASIEKAFINELRDAYQAHEADRQSARASYAKN